VSRAKDQNTLLVELENLQQMLDTPQGGDAVLTLDDILDLDDITAEDIPTLSNAELVVEEPKPAPAMLKAVETKPALKAVENTVTQEPEAPVVADAIPEMIKPTGSQNPYLPHETLNRLAYERKAAADTAANALDVMAKVAEQKKQQQQGQTSDGQMTRLEKQHIIDELVEEMLPAIEARLRAKLARLIK